ncbi:hypothetical protein BC829DRAFT_192371 [Chytridium lagenaria]|nr:hypothetical protein BC829DRAFT_192371 [Chytridium lagenaria]
MNLSCLDLSLDEFLGGGFRVGAITELFGEDATGKTQLALQLCFSVQLPFQQGGLESGILLHI